MDEWAGDYGVAQPSEPEVEVTDQGSRSERWCETCTEWKKETSEDGSNSLDKPVVYGGMKTANTSLMQYLESRNELGKTLPVLQIMYYTLSSMSPAGYDVHLDYSTKQSSSEFSNPSHSLPYDPQRKAHWKIMKLRKTDTQCFSGAEYSNPYMSIQEMKYTPVYANSVTYKISYTEGIVFLSMKIKVFLQLLILIIGRDAL